jgi:hypothetical protein
LSTSVEERPRPSPDAEEPARRRGLPDWLKGNVLLLPMTVWFVLLLVIPMVIVIQ